MHQKMAATMEKCLLEIRAIQRAARRIPGLSRSGRDGRDYFAHAEGWTCPKEFGWAQLEGSWRAHQIPITDPVTNPAH